MHSNMALHPIVYTILYIFQSPIEKENMGDMSLPKNDQRLRVREIEERKCKEGIHVLSISIDWS